MVSSCQNQKAFEGKTVAQIAAAMGQDPAHAMMDFLVAEEGTASIIMFMMSEENVARGIAHPHVMIGSDSLALATGQGGKPHPRTGFDHRVGHLWRLRMMSASSKPLSSGARYLYLCKRPIW